MLVAFRPDSTQTINSLFVVEFGLTSVGVTNWREGEDNLNGEMVRAKARESAPLTVGSERRKS